MTLNQTLQKYRNPLAKSILVKILIFSSFVTLLLTSYQLFSDYNHQVKDLNEKVTQLNAVHIKPISQALWTFNEELLKIQVKSLTQTKGISYAAITSENQKISYGNNDTREQFLTIKSYPIHFDHNGQKMNLGTLKIHSSTKEILDNVLNKSLLILTTQFIKTLIVSAFILLVLFRSVINPLFKLAEYTKKINLDNLYNDIHLDKKFTHYLGEKNSLGQIVTAINLMTNQIKEDLIEKEKMNKKMEDAKKSRLLEKLAGGVAHDFNNILQVIHNCNDMIDHYHEYPEKISKYTHLSSRATRFGQEIAQDILIYSKEKNLKNLH